MASNYTQYLNLTLNDLQKKYSVDVLSGLTKKTVNERLKSDGYNLLPQLAKRSLLTIFINQFTNGLVLLLLLAFLVSLLLHRLEDAIFIAFALLLNAAIGSWQEYKAEQIVADLSKLASPKARIRREGLVKELNAETIVKGDVLVLEAGDIVPADCRLISGFNMAVDESILTGESLPTTKSINPINHQVGIKEASNVLFLGTKIIRGSGEAIVFATGKNTESGSIAKDTTHAKKPKTPLEQQILKFTKKALIWISLFIVLIFIMGITVGNDISEMLISSISLAVAAIPEGLPLLVTVVLAFGTHQMSGQKALVRKQNAVEVLGQVKTLITDKTGTLTKNSIAVSQVILPTKTGFKKVSVTELKSLMIGLNQLTKVVWLVTKTSHKSVSSFIDPIDLALLNFAQKYYKKTDKKIAKQLLFEIPFSSEYKYSAAFYKQNDKIQIFVKGSHHTIAKYLSYVQYSESKKRYQTKQKNSLSKIIEKQAELGEKTITVAECKITPSEFKKANMETATLDKLLTKRLEYVGSISFEDPIRANVSKTIQLANDAGVQVVMATGDNKAVAYSVGKQIGINRHQIHYDITPHNKLELVKHYQKGGGVVAMTGDGVNDAVALKQADIGLAMGLSGTAIAKEASDIVILDDNIETIIKAIESGRTIFRNIQRVITYLLSTNLSEVLVIFISVLSSGLIPIPLLPTQILWINLITDGLTVIPLSLEPSHSDVMLQKPRKRGQPLLGRIFWSTILSTALIIVIITLVGFTYVWRTTQDLQLARSVAFALLAFTQIFNLLNLRSIKQSFLKMSLKSNPGIIYSFSASVVIQILIFYLPLTQKYLSLKPLSISTMIAVISFSSLVFWLTEVKKIYIKKDSA